MPELPEVRQDFVADADEYLRTLDEMIARAEALVSANHDVRDSIAEMALAAQDASGLVRELDDVLDDLYISAGGAARELGNLRESMDEAGAAGAAVLGSSLTSVDGKLDDLIGHAAAAVAEIHDLRTALLGVAAAGVAARAGTDGAAASAGRAAFAFGRWGITANAIHWIIAGTAEFLAVALPAAIAISLGGFVLYQGVVEDVTRRMTAMYGATEATASMIGKTSGDLLGLGHAFQTAQDAANPIAYQLLGEYINAARAHMVDFAGAGLEVARAVGELGGRSTLT